MRSALCGPRASTRRRAGRCASLLGASWLVQLLLVQLLLVQLREILAVDIDILVAAAGEIHDEDLARAIGRALDGFGDGVRAFERRDNALDAGEAARGVERFGVAGGNVLGTAAI